MDGGGRFYFSQTDRSIRLDGLLRLLVICTRSRPHQNVRYQKRRYHLPTFRRNSIDHYFVFSSTRGFQFTRVKLAFNPIARTFRLFGITNSNLTGHIFLKNGFSWLNNDFRLSSFLIRFTLLLLLCGVFISFIGVG